MMRLRACKAFADPEHETGIFTYSLSARSGTHRGDKALNELVVTKDLRIPMSEIELTAVRSQGPGGQNVNKVASAIHLRFDVRRSTSLPDSLRATLLEKKDRRITADGVIVIKSQRYRTQDRNRQDALDRLARLLQSAARPRKKRIPTRPGKKARQKRLDDKRHRSTIKKTRGQVTGD